MKRFILLCVYKCFFPTIGTTMWTWAGIHRWNTGTYTHTAKHLMNKFSRFLTRVWTETTAFSVRNVRVSYFKRRLSWSGRLQSRGLHRPPRRQKSGKNRQVSPSFTLQRVSFYWSSRWPLVCITNLIFCCGRSARRAPRLFEQERTIFRRRSQYRSRFPAEIWVFMLPQCS